MSDDRKRWDERYAGRAGERGAADGSPSEFLVTHATMIRGLVLDVAAGNGRNALFLARNGCRVEALDISFAGLREARARALSEGLSLYPVQVDLQTFPLPRDRYDAVINIRYLQRSLFPALRRAVKPGGIILFETFLIDQQALGHPRNPEFLLQRGELHAAFADCQIISYEEGLFEESRRAYLARMVARRPAPKQD